MTHLLPHMPDGRPCPHLLTQAELVEFLRIDVKFPHESINKMRKNGLRGTQVSKHVLFRIHDVLEFLDYEQKRNPR